MSLLDDVSIVVTPNGYKAGELYAVVPVPTEGAEILSQPVDLVTDFSVNSGGVIVDADTFTTAGGIFDGIRKNSFLTLGKRYKLTIEGDTTSSGFTIGDTAASGNEYGTDFGTFYFTAVGNRSLWIRQTTSGTTNITSFTLKEYTAADMDVTRATAATRVDEAGLVNYAEIVSDTEEVVNGDFATDSDWNTSATGISIAGGKLSRDATATLSIVQPSSVITPSVTYKITFEIVDYTSGTLTPRFGYNGTGGTAVSGVGTYTQIITKVNQNVIELYGTAFIGSIYNVSVKEVTRDNVPRIDYSGGGCPHILAEPQRTNLITYSEDFTDSSWATFDCTVGSTSNIQPNGVNEGYSLTYTADIGVARTFESVVSGSSYTFSAYIKSSQNGTIKMARSNQPADGQYINVTTDWKRFDVQITPTSTTDGGGFYRLLASDLSSIEVYGAQLEEGSYSTSYIPTSGSTVTRNQDQFSRDGIGSLINSEEGVLFLEFAALEPTASLNNWITITDGTTNATNYIAFVFETVATGGIVARATVGGVTTAYISTSALDQSINRKLAFKWKENDFAFWINGVEVGTDVSGSTFPTGTLNKLTFSYNDLSNNLIGKVKQLQVYKTALTDSQLTSLTS